MKKVVSLGLGTAMALSMSVGAFAAETAYTPKFYKENSTTSLSMANDVFAGQAIVDDEQHTVTVPIKSFYVKKFFVSGNGAMLNLDIKGINEQCKVEYIPEDIDSQGNIIMSKEDPARGKLEIDFTNAPNALQNLQDGIPMAARLDYKLSVISGWHSHKSNTVNFQLQ